MEQFESLSDAEKQEQSRDVENLTDETKQIATRTFKKIFEEFDENKKKLGDL